MPLRNGQVYESLALFVDSSDQDNHLESSSYARHRSELVHIQAFAGQSAAARADLAASRPNPRVPYCYCADSRPPAFLDELATNARRLLTPDPTRSRTGS